MSHPFKQKGFAFYWDRALERESQGRWSEAKEAWRRALKFAKSWSERDQATRRREFCKRKLEQMRGEHDER